MMKFFKIKKEWHVRVFLIGIILFGIFYSIKGPYRTESIDQRPALELKGTPSPSPPKNKALEHSSAVIKSTTPFIATERKSGTLSPQVSSPSLQSQPSSPGTELPRADSLKAGCFTLHFTHKKLSTHSDPETCFEHENEISLKLPKSSTPLRGINSRSVCVLVDGRVAHFRANPSDPSRLVFAPIAGPQSKIAARFCLGHSLCSQKCVPQKDAFLNVLEGDEEDTTPVGSWDGSRANSDEENQLNSEVQAIDHEKGQLGSHRPVFSDWLMESVSEGCEESASSQNGGSE